MAFPCMKRMKKGGSIEIISAIKERNRGRMGSAG